MVVLVGIVMVLLVVDINVESLDHVGNPGLDPSSQSAMRVGPDRRQNKKSRSLLQPRLLEVLSQENVEDPPTAEWSLSIGRWPSG